MKRFVVAVALMLSLLAVAASAQSTGYTAWSAPENLGPVVNSAYRDTCVAVSKNGLSLFFFSNRYARDVNATWHLYVSKRASVDESWGEPQEIVGFNEGYGASCPALSLDEHRLYFASGRPGGCGMNDIWVSRRHDRRDDFGWGPPVNLGCVVNSTAQDFTPALFEDETGAVVMYFGSTRPGGAGGSDIYASRMRADDTFDPPAPVSELNSTATDYCAAVRRDGLEVVFASNRSGGLGSDDLWTATRARTADPWSLPVNLTVLNSPAIDGGRMQFSFDGRQLYFKSRRDGFYGDDDLYVATREKLRQ